MVLQKNGAIQTKYMNYAYIWSMCACRFDVIFVFLVFLEPQNTSLFSNTFDVGSHYNHSL